jgi:hypothetical protein
VACRRPVAVGCVDNGGHGPSIATPDVYGLACGGLLSRWTRL